MYSSIAGNAYLCVLYNYDANYIDAVPMSSKTKHQILAAYKNITMMLKNEDSHQNYKN